MDALELLFQGIGSVPQDNKWLEQMFVVLIRLLTSTPWKSLDCLIALEKIADTLSEILLGSLSHEASDAALIVRPPVFSNRLVLMRRIDYMETSRMSLASRKLP